MGLLFWKTAADMSLLVWGNMIHGVNHCYAQSKYFLFRFSEDPAGLTAHAYFIAPDFILGHFWRHFRRLFCRALLEAVCADVYDPCIASQPRLHCCNNGSGWDAVVIMVFNYSGL